MQKAQGYAGQGSVSFLTDLGGNDTTAYATYPGCTVTVYDTGTTDLSTIYSDNLGSPTPKANPFTSDATTAYWFFYAANGTYDVRFSGTGIVTPFTLGGFILNDFASGSFSDLAVTGNLTVQGTSGLTGDLTVGTTDLVVDVSENKVGVGIAPVRELHVSASAATSHILLNNTTIGSTVTDGLDVSIDTSGNAGVWNYEAGYLRFGTNNLERVRIASDGKVGVGTDSPQSTLHVVGGGISLDSDQYVAFCKTSSDYRDVADIRGHYTDDNSGYLQFYTRGSGSLDERVRVTADGKVLIGETAATYAASIVETTKAQDSLTAFGVTNQNSGSSACAGLIIGSYGNSWVVSCGSTAKDTNALTFAVDATASPPSEKIRFTTAGYVGIGATPGVKLHVTETSSGGRATAAFLQNAAVATSTATSLDFSAHTSAVTGRIDHIFDGTDYEFAISTYSGSLTEKIRITGSGRLGVGSNNPSAWCHIVAPSDSNVPGLQVYKGVAGTSTEDVVRVYNSDAGGTLVFSIKANSSIMMGSAAALADNATDGFTYIPTCAGNPSGTPTAVTGKCPIVYVTGTNRLYIYNGAWKYAAMS